MIINRKINLINYLFLRINFNEAEFALRGIGKPMIFSKFNLTEILPKELKSSLPSIEELERFFKFDN